MRRPLVIFFASTAAMLAVLSLLLIPVSIVVGHPLNVVGEVVVLGASVFYIARVMREDRRRRREAEAALPPERRPARRTPRRPITFQIRETLVAFLIWSVLVAFFNALVLQIGPLANAGISVFAGFMLATLTVTGRHMMFRLTAEEDTER